MSKLTNSLKKSNNCIHAMGTLTGISPCSELHKSATHLEVRVDRLIQFFSALAAKSANTERGHAL